MKAIDGFPTLEEAISKKPLTVENQIVTDEKGRRRFHGAFTGGFSAGYFNSVGSKEGKVSADLDVPIYFMFHFRMDTSGFQIFQD